MSCVKKIAFAAFAIACVTLAHAQSFRPQFEVVSIKESILPPGFVGGGHIETPPSGHVNITRATLRMLLHEGLPILRTEKLTC